MHYTICLQLISSSGQIALPPAFARLKQRGDELLNPSSGTLMPLPKQFHFQHWFPFFLIRILATPYVAAAAEKTGGEM